MIPAGPRGYVEGAGAEGVQQWAARARRLVSMLSHPSANRLHGQPVRVLRADLTGPQVFPVRPAVGDAATTAAIGDEARPHLPGRLPVTGWDGEPGPAAPLHLGGRW